MEVSTHSTEETQKLAKEIAKKITKGSVVALYGDLGSGKTTFTRYLVEALGLKARVQSPTFVLARKYQNDFLVVNHLDLYRLTSKGEALDIGMEEYLKNPNEITVIEWPEIIEDILPKGTVRIYFEYAGENDRKIKLQNLH